MATATPSIVPLVQFRVGELRAAVAAYTVEGISTQSEEGDTEHDHETVHIASLMGASAAIPDSTQRRIRLRNASAATELIVDGPVTMAHVTVQEIVPMNSVLVRSGVIMGFASLNGEVVLLLDVPKLLNLATAGEHVKGP
jgi:hypothetical protein